VNQKGNDLGNPIPPEVVPQTSGSLRFERLRITERSVNSVISAQSGSPSSLMPDVRADACPPNASADAGLRRRPTTPAYDAVLRATSITCSTSSRLISTDDLIDAVIVLLRLVIVR